MRTCPVSTGGGDRGVDRVGRLPAGRRRWSDRSATTRGCVDHPGQRRRPHGTCRRPHLGFAVAATITVGAAEADRVAAGQPRDRVTDLETVITAGADPRIVGVTRTGLPPTPSATPRCGSPYAPVTGPGAVDDRDRLSIPSPKPWPTPAPNPGPGSHHPVGHQRPTNSPGARDGGCLLSATPADARPTT